MPVGTFLLFLSNVILGLKTLNVITADGAVVIHDAETALKVAAMVELELKAAGVTVPAVIDQVLAILPGILSLFPKTAAA